MKREGWRYGEGRSGGWRAWAATRTAAGHTRQIADPLAEAIVKQFPDRYRG